MLLSAEPIPDRLRKKLSMDADLQIALGEQKIDVAEHQRDAQRDQEMLAKGIGKGECLVLQRQMAKRFGHLPEWALRRLEQATQPEIEHWADRILEVDSLGAVFQ